MTHGLRAYDGLSLPEDTETVTAGRAGWTHSYLSDDEDLLADDASGGKPGVSLEGRLTGTVLTPSVRASEGPVKVTPSGALKDGP